MREPLYGEGGSHDAKSLLSAQRMACAAKHRCTPSHPSACFRRNSLLPTRSPALGTLTCAVESQRCCLALQAVEGGKGGGKAQARELCGVVGMRVVSGRIGCNCAAAAYATDAGHHVAIQACEVRVCARVHVCVEGGAVAPAVESARPRLRTLHNSNFKLSHMATAACV